VDDTPYGGGAGMVMKPEPWGEALDDVFALGETPLLLVPTPSGRPLHQSWVEELACRPRLVVACGRYEGIDARVFDEAAERVQVAEFSLGDYVLNGGEVAALALIAAVGRLLPGVVGNAESLVEESHSAASGGLLEYPVYTKPEFWRGRPVPPVLLSGHHGAVARWRRDEALRRTSHRRPDLVARLDPGSLDRADLAVLDECGWIVDEGDGGQRRLVRRPAAVAD
ncbi:MAG: tRNA (guanosine(37)-N1)-methyltransferase TrmD, partial [Actinomycetes bacterium]